jgi:hypothetical protein
MASSGDHLGTGIVASLAHPGGNVTGLSAFATEIQGKQLDGIVLVYRPGVNPPAKERPMHFILFVPIGLIAGALAGRVVSG